jgi:hypothetical protein
VARAISRNIFGFQSSVWKFVDCGLIPGKGCGLFVSWLELFWFWIYFQMENVHGLSPWLMVHGGASPWWIGDRGHGGGSLEDGRNGAPVRGTSSQLRKKREGMAVILTGCKRGRQRGGGGQAIGSSGHWWCKLDEVRNEEGRRSFRGKNRHGVDLTRPLTPFIGRGGDLNGQEEGSRRCRWVIKDFKAPVTEGADGVGALVREEEGRRRGLLNFARRGGVGRRRADVVACCRPAVAAACVWFPGGRKVATGLARPKRPSGPKLLAKVKRKFRWVAFLD